MSDVLDGVSVMPLSSAVVDRASMHADVDLGSLDSIHLATAFHVVESTGQQFANFVSYDERLLTARAVWE